MKFVALMLPLLILMMCRYRRCQGRNLGLQIFANKGALQRLNRFFFETFRFTITYVDHDIGEMRVGQFTDQLFS